MESFIKGVDIGIDGGQLNDIMKQITGIMPSNMLIAA